MKNLFFLVLLSFLKINFIEAQEKKEVEKVFYSAFETIKNLTTKSNSESTRSLLKSVNFNSWFYDEDYEILSLIFVDIVLQLNSFYLNEDIPISLKEIISEVIKNFRNLNNNKTEEDGVTFARVPDLYNNKIIKFFCLTNVFYIETNKQQINYYLRNPEAEIYVNEYRKQLVQIEVEIFNSKIKMYEQKKLFYYDKNELVPKNFEYFSQKPRYTGLLLLKEAKLIFKR